MRATVDYSARDVPEVVMKKQSFGELNHVIKEKLKGRIVVLGACTWTVAAMGRHQLPIAERAATTSTAANG
jgi:hypothetical protein